ncbi:partner of Y14 and mago-like isoform X2 [Zingiber officinale]|uniref:partner of Y14 and mago-like isoform X2 n=1 Tax=Zingiber officinale TaxID=94328 RepID=UPI001C4C757C|nr:partner of Y14 and mago-like isoform X2 [Zingiber officinale]
MGPMAKAGGAPPAIRLLSIPKEGERVLAPTRRPDGILRKPIRIRAGYVPQDEVAIYQSKGALLSKSSEATVPPGYDPDLAEKTKTKSARRNERKKEKRHQAALEKEKNMVSEGAEVVRTAKFVSADGTSQIEEFEAVTEHISRITLLAMPAIPEVSNSSAEPMEVSKTKSSGQDFDKKIPALKKKKQVPPEKLKPIPSEMPNDLHLHSSSRS